VCSARVFIAVFNILVLQSANELVTVAASCLYPCLISSSSNGHCQCPVSGRQVNIVISQLQRRPAIYHKVVFTAT
jgi:hypothetical protein